MKEKKEKKEKIPMDPVKKKKIIKRSIFGGVALIFVLFIGNSIIAAGKSKPIVYTQTVGSGDLEQTINTSGTVMTEQVQHFFAQVSIPVGEVNVAVGDMVKSGDILFSYNQEDLEREKELADLTLQANDGSYKSSIQKNNESLGNLGEASVNLNVLDQQIADTEAYIAELEKKIDKKKSDLAYEGALLQISILDWANQPDSDEYLNLQKLAQLNSYEQVNNEDLLRWGEDLKTHQTMLAEYKEYKAEMKSQKTGAESSKMNQGAKQELDANTKSKELQSEQTKNAIEEVKEGVKAEFDGVVTEVNVVEGASSAVGTQLLVLESTEKIKVEISVSKYDLEKIQTGQKADITIAGNVYEGEISKISKLAVPNASGSPVVAADIKILNPDKEIYLGVEAKIILHTDEARDVIILPVETVNTDKEGDFVYAVEENIMVKKRIVTGITSDVMIEVKEGLNIGDQVVTDMIFDVEEGTEVTAIPLS